jgi:hypothetical protein
MAKVTNPLLSMVASGQIGKSIVFDKRGRARVYVVPANPQTVDQQAVRNTLGDIQRELKQLGLVLRAQLRTGFGPTWNSIIIGELMANDNAALDAYVAEFNAFIAGDKTAWATEDTATLVAIADGAALYATASAVYDIAQRLGVTVSLALPATGNSSTVKTNWTANA